MNICESTDVDYLKTHFSRFILTKSMVDKSLAGKNAHILDIGAHWLHQSVLYALVGHRVTAADFSNPMDDQAVRDITEKHSISRLIYADLSSENVFDELSENSMDYVLFCEIIEHITFSPIGMWKAIYRILKPGGKIIVTTPNYYFVAVSWLLWGIF